MSPLSHTLARPDREVAVTSHGDVVHPPAPPPFRSQAYLEALRRLERFARQPDELVLLEGEQGTGKTSLAQHLHDHSPRRSRVLHRVDLGTLDDELSASDLFGHASGAFTGATSHRRGHVVAASGGTLFLDELGKASLGVQRKLLHLVEARQLTAVGTDRPVPVDIRVVAATNVPLATLVEAGTFLPDLQHRIGLCRVRIPPLRERRQDIEPLAVRIVATQSPRLGYVADRPPGLHPELVAALGEYTWPGNVRQLAGVLRYLLIVAEGAPQLTLDHCDAELAFLTQRISATERAHRALTATGSKAAAARRLGIARTTLDRHLREPGSTIAPNNCQVPAPG